MCDVSVFMYLLSVNYMVSLSTRHQHQLDIYIIYNKLTLLEN